MKGYNYTKVTKIKSSKQEEGLKEYKRKCVIAARELGYGKKVIDTIKRAKTSIEITNILRNARLKNK